MKYIILSFLVFGFLSCEDKVSEPTTTYVTTPSICPPSHPESEPSQIQFTGAKEVTDITKTSAKIHWDHVQGISSYHIILISSTERKIIKTLGAPKKSFKISALTPDTEYNYLVRAMDTRGHLDTNTEVLTFKTLPWPNYTNQKSLRLNSSQSISLGSSSSLPLIDKFTFSIWAKTSVSATSDSRIFTAHEGDFASTAISIGVQGDKVKVFYRDEDGNLKNYSEVFAYDDGNWHQYVITYNKRFISLYIDGNRLLRKKFKVRTIGSHPAFIGSYSGIQKGFSGKVDEAAFFKTDFNQREINELYNTADLKAHPEAANLAHWYQFGDDSSDSILNIEDVIGGLSGSPLNITQGDFVLDSPL
jgi:hypothetical protein